MSRSRAAILEIDVTPAARLGVHHLEQYVGPWAMEESHLEALQERVRAMDLAAHVGDGLLARSDAAPGGSRGAVYELTPDGVAVFEVVGTLTKYGSSLSDAPSMLELKRDMRRVKTDRQVRGVVMRIESPGGTFQGMPDLADEVAAVAAVKPVIAFVEDIGASGGYWLASQAGRVYANAAADVGSLGTFGVYVDSSAAAARGGMKVYVVKAGEFKGAGVPGAPITDAQLAEFQRRVEASNEIFLASVARGRGMSIERVRQLADGRVHKSAEALKLGLIDGVGGFEQALAEAAAGQGALRVLDAITPSETNAGDRVAATTKESLMADPSTTTAPAKVIEPATIEQIEQACKGAPADFVLDLVKRKATLEQCVAADRDRLAAALQNRDEELKKAQTKAAESAAETTRAAALGSPGNKPVGDAPPPGKGGKAADATSGGDAESAFKGYVDANIKAGMDRAAAWATAARDHEDEHAAYLEAYNARHGRKARR